MRISYRLPTLVFLGRFRARYPYINNSEFVTLYALSTCHGSRLSMTLERPTTAARRCYTGLMSTPYLSTQRTRQSLCERFIYSPRQSTHYASLLTSDYRTMTSNPAQSSWLQVRARRSAHATCCRLPFLRARCAVHYRWFRTALKIIDRFAIIFLKLFGQYIQRRWN